MNVCIRCDGKGHYRYNKKINGQYTFLKVFCDCKVGKALQNEEQNGRKRNEKKD